MTDYNASQKAKNMPKSRRWKVKSKNIYLNKYGFGFVKDTGERMIEYVNKTDRKIQ